MTTLWLANTASLLLPVSNLTNLLALHPFGDLGVGTLGYIRLMALPALAAVVATVAVLWLLHRRDLRGTYAAPPPADPHDVVLMRITGGVCLLLAPAFVIGIQPAIASVPAAALLLAATYWRAPELLRRIKMPWLTVLGICVLFLVIDAALRLGLEAWLRTAVGPGTSTLDLLRVSGIGTLAANGINNLPPTSPSSRRSPTRRPASPPCSSASTPADHHDVGLGRDAALGHALPLRRPHGRAGRIARTGALCAVTVVLATPSSSPPPPDPHHRRRVPISGHRPVVECPRPDAGRRGDLLVGTVVRSMPVGRNAQTTSLSATPP